jgi:hypothetical protein
MNDGFDSVPDRPTASLDSLEMEFRTLISMAARIVSDAMKGGGEACMACGNTPFTDTDAALKGLSRIESILEKVGKMRGLIRAGAAVTTNIAETAEWAQLRSKLLRALEKHPLALADVRVAMGTAGPQEGYRPPSHEPAPAPRVLLLGPGVVPGAPPPPKRGRKKG